MTGKVSTSCQFPQPGLDPALGKPHKPSRAGIAQLVEHLICNQVTSEQSQSHSCQPPIESRPVSAVVGPVLSTGRA